MKNLLLTSLVGGLVLYVWSFVSWMAIPWHDVREMPGGDEVAAILKNADLEKAVYTFPFTMGSDQSQVDKAMEQYKSGPRIHMMVYDPAGGDPSNPKMFIGGLVIDFLLAFIACYILFVANEKFPTLASKLKYFLMFGAFTALSAPLMEWNWWEFPTGYSITNAIDLIIAWLLAGFVMSKMLKPKAV